MYNIESEAERAIEAGLYDEFLNGETEHYWKQKAIEDVLKSGLTHETLKMANVKVYHSLTSTDIKKALNHKTLEQANQLYERHKLIAFPYSQGLIRYKILPPLDENRKYLQPTGTLAYPYILSIVNEIKTKQHKEIWLTEGEKKTLCLIQFGEYCIGVGGVWNFKGGIDDYLWQELEAFIWKSRVVYIAFDSDLHEKPQVREAMYEFAFKLYAKGAYVKIVVWDPSIGKGIDDYIVCQPDPAKAIEGLKKNAVNLMDFINTEHSNEVIRGLAHTHFYERYDEVIKTVAKRIGKTEKGLKQEITNKKQEIELKKFDKEKEYLERKLSEICNHNELCTIPDGYTLLYNGFDVDTSKQEQSVLASLHRTDEGIETIPLCKPFIVSAYVKTHDGTKQVLKSTRGKEIIVDVALSDTKVFDKEVGSRLLGVTLTRQKIQKLIDYVHEYQMANKERIETLKGLESTGWRGDTFYIPSRNQTGILWMEDRLTEAFKVKGDRDQQAKLFQGLLTRRVGIVLLLGLAAPLLRKFSIKNVTFHLSGLLHGGKSCSMYFAMSLFGNPDKLFNTWNGTKVGKEIFTSMFADMPIWLDDWETAGLHSNEIINLIYDFEGGKGKTRGTKGLHLQEDKRYRGILLSTGEKDIDTLVESLKHLRTVPRGAYRRTIEFPVDEKFFKSLGDNTPLERDKLEAFLVKLYTFASEHYGWIGREWIEYIEKKENMEHLKTLYQENLKRVHNTGGLNGIFALLLTVLHSPYLQSFLSEEQRAMVETHIFSVAEKQQTKNTEIRDIATEFLNKVKDYCYMNARNILGIGDTETVLKSGIYGKVLDGDVFLLSSTLEDICKKHGFVKKQVLSELDKRGQLKKNKCGEKETFTYKHSIENIRQTGYYILNAFEDELEEMYKKIMGSSDNTCPQSKN
jgi:uncharacterized protein (DUF927 family)